MLVGSQPLAWGSVSNECHICDMEEKKRCSTHANKVGRQERGSKCIRPKMEVQTGSGKLNVPLVTLDLNRINI